MRPATLRPAIATCAWRGVWGRWCGCVKFVDGGIIPSNLRPQIWDLELTWGRRMKRRDFLAIATAAIFPLTVRAQESQRVIGLLSSIGSSATGGLQFSTWSDAFSEGL